MLLHIQIHELGFTTARSLIAVLAVLVISIAASLIWPDKCRKKRKAISELTGEDPL